MNKVQKAIHRIIRILTFRTGIYGTYGIGNEFKSGIRLDEDTKIGNYNYIGNHVVFTKALLGSYCSIADNVVIGPGDHDYRNISTRSIVLSSDARNHFTDKPVTIGNDVWIGVNAVILRGVKIGNGAVIASGAVVNRDVPDFAVVGGVPSKVIKYRFSESMIKKITDSKWWEKDLSDAKRIVAELSLMKED